MKTTRNETTLTFQDLFCIFDIQAVRSNHLRGRGRKIYVFEYLARFEQNAFFQLMESLGIDVQIHIVKERLDDVMGALVGTEWIDVSIPKEVVKSEFEVKVQIRNEKSGLRSLKMTKESLLRQAVDDSLYRHYAIFTAYDDEQISVEQAIYRVIRSMGELQIPIRQIQGEELRNYLFRMLNPPYRDKEDLARDKKYLSVTKGDIQLGNSFESNFWSYVEKSIHHIGNLLFHRSIVDVEASAMEAFCQEIGEGINYVRIGKRFKGGFVVRSIPKDKFNILAFIGKNIEFGDSITINVYPGNYHRLDEYGKKTGGIEQAYRKFERNATTREDEVYVSIIVNFVDLSPGSLKKRMRNFDTAMLDDFQLCRIDTVMSRYLQSTSGIGLNSLHLERSLKLESLKNGRLLF